MPQPDKWTGVSRVKTERFVDVLAMICQILKHKFVSNNDT